MVDSHGFATSWWINRYPASPCQINGSFTLRYLWSTEYLLGNTTIAHAQDDLTFATMKTRFKSVEWKMWKSERPIWFRINERDVCSCLGEVSTFDVFLKQCFSRVEQALRPKVSRERGASFFTGEVMNPGPLNRREKKSTQKSIFDCFLRYSWRLFSSTAWTKRVSDSLRESSVCSNLVFIFHNVASLCVQGKTIWHPN